MGRGGGYTFHIMLADAGMASFPELSGKLHPEQCAKLVALVTSDPATLAPVRTLKDELRQAGISFAADEFERLLLRSAAAIGELRIAELPVPESVRTRLREEFRFYTQPPGKESFDAGSYLFTTGCQVVSLRRFPAGPMDWEVSGFPRSWLLRVPKMDLPRVCLFLARRLGGFHPLFLIHVARRPKNRSLLIEKEVLRAYYRMVRSLELQPSVLGIMASAWFHDPVAAASEPHLACLSRPYLEEGGLITTAGPAAPDSGFLEHNIARKEQLESGKLIYRIGLALWPRREAIAWAGRHPELED